MIKLPEKKWFKFTELIQRWQCTEQDIYQLILNGQLVPSYHLSGDFALYEVTPQELETSGGLFLDEVCEVTKGGLINQVFKGAYGFHYLMQPEVTNGNEGIFRFASDLRNCPDVGNRCLLLSPNLSVADVFNDGVVMATEVASFEAACDDKGQIDKPIRDRERDTLLNIIGALVEIVQVPKPGRDSDAAVIRELLENYSDKSGIRERTLQEKFAAAKRSLHSH